MLSMLIFFYISHLLPSNILQEQLAVVFKAARHLIRSCWAQQILLISNKVHLHYLRTSALFNVPRLVFLREIDYLSVVLIASGINCVFMTVFVSTIWPLNKVVKSVL